MNKRTHLVVFIFVVASIAAAVSVHQSENVQAQTGLISGTIIPLYTYPTSPTWNTIVNAKIAHPHVPIIAIVNPSNGPGSAQDTNFVYGINKLRAHGVIVIGYVPTGYGSRSITSTENLIYKWRLWYSNVNGILFDEMSNVKGYENYYRTLNSYAKALGFTYTVGNPGTDVPSTYVGTVNTILIYERQGLPSLSYLDGWHSYYSRNNWGVTSYADPTLNPSWITSAKNYVGYIYITNDILYPNPFDSLPSYFSTLISYLD